MQPPTPRLFRHAKITRTVLMIAITAICCPALSAQFGEPGLMLTFGVGTGYSSHGDDYQIDELYRVREYTGFRALIFETKLGWRLGEQTFIHLTGRVSPANTTISPYRYYYGGAGLAQSFYFMGPVYVHGGIGLAKAGVESGRHVATGVMKTAGVGIHISTDFFMELATVFGNYDPRSDLSPNPFDARESQFQVVFMYGIR
ncbi:MAG: hypothetical protein R3301_13475 [Saprospiraceae bacterium]|nr:hypothetical protein [Saprospiraceae bacterium]